MVRPDKEGRKKYGEGGIQNCGDATFHTEFFDLQKGRGLSIQESRAGSPQGPSSLLLKLTLEKESTFHRERLGYKIVRKKKKSVKKERPVTLRGRVDGLLTYS